MFKEIIKKFNKTTLLKNYNNNSVGIEFKNNVLFLKVMIRDRGLICYTYQYDYNYDGPDYETNIKLSSFMDLILSNQFNIDNLKNIEYCKYNIVNPLDETKRFTIKDFKKELDSFVDFLTIKKLELECRDYMEGLYIQINKETIDMTITNGHILKTKKIINTSGVDSGEFLIRGAHLKIIHKNIKKDTDIFFNVFDDALHIFFNNICIFSLNTKKYPEYNKLFTYYSENFINLERDKLINSTITKEDKDYITKEPIQYKYIKELDKWFDSRYLKLIYNVIKDDIIKINLSNKGGEVFFYKDNIKIILMNSRL